MIDLFPLFLPSKRMLKNLTLTTILILLISMNLFAGIPDGQPRLPNKMVPIDNPVYRILLHYETNGKLPILPQAKPYTRQKVNDLLLHLVNDPTIAGREKKLLEELLADMERDTNGVPVYRQEGENSYALIGFGAETTYRQGGGDHGTWSVNLTALPFISGDLGKNISFSAGVGPSIEKLAPDLFYKSYTYDGKVHLPATETGTAWLPYQFGFESLYSHTLISGKKSGQPEITRKLAVGWVYFSELTGSWWNGIFQLSIHNQRRAWGPDNHNLLLSSTARRIPAVEMKLEPASWLRYSYLTGSLFSPTSQNAGYRTNIYGYDTGELQNLLTIHLLEFTPSKWLQISAHAGNVWAKRLELNYLMPFVFSHFSELEVGDYDNLAMGVDVAIRLPHWGKSWISFYNDEFSFTESGPLLRMPRNRYAFQAGWNTTLLSGLLPGTSSTLKFTRLTPFVYTHYPETRLKTMTGRPHDMTYRHDGFNIGFYLPPNSGELHWNLTNIAVPGLLVTLDNRLIMHGTNDLKSSNVYQIYGDIYRHQLTDQSGTIYDYPLTRFTRDGIYDYTILSKIGIDRKIRYRKKPGYFRVKGNLGVSHTWWESNQSNVVAPGKITQSSGSLGVIVDIL